MWESIGIGLLTSCIFLGLTYVIGVHLWPTYIVSKYKGTKIDGEWDVFYEGINEASALIVFEQKGTKITGSSSVAKNKAGVVVNRKYNYKGTFLNNSVVLTFEDANSPLMFGGAMVFHHIDCDAKEMTGKSIYFKPEKNEVDSSTAKLVKR